MHALFSDSAFGMKMYVVFVWVYEMERYEGRKVFALLFNHWGRLICLLQGAAIFY